MANDTVPTRDNFLHQKDGFRLITMPLIQNLLEAMFQGVLECQAFPLVHVSLGLIPSEVGDQSKQAVIEMQGRLQKNKKRATRLQLMHIYTKLLTAVDTGKPWSKIKLAHSDNESDFRAKSQFSSWEQRTVQSRSRSWGQYLTIPWVKLASKTQVLD